MIQSVRTFIFVTGLLAAGVVVSAFGTIHGLGQNAEHERITRHALACGQKGGPDAATCFQPYSLDQIAGKRGTFGAVGAPDNPTRGLISKNAAHCDNGDWMDTPGYPHSREDAADHLYACRKWMEDNLKAAVTDAAALLKNGRIDDTQIPTLISCTFNGHKGRAKCNVLEDFGLTLHAAQDFYAHSNWVDRPGAGPVTLENPPGLDKSGPSPFLDLKRNPPVPDGLMTGCFVQKGITDIKGLGGCTGRAPHYYLNKDDGRIDPMIGAGTTPRGKIDHNFKRAVEAAIAETRRKWATLRGMLIARYGKRDGRLMICALTHDDPAGVCK